MTLTGATRTFALLGRPVHHSASPRLHNTWLRALDIDARYVALDVPPERGGAVVDALRTLGLAGVNLTVPLKEAVLPHLDALAPSAEAAGAANVVVREADRLIGHNTDGSGLVAHLRTRDVDWRRPAVVLGAGGAGRAVAAGLQAAGVPVVHLLNRTEARAQRVAGVLGDRVEGGPLTPDAFSERVAEAGLVVQATSGGGRTLVDTLAVDTVRTDALWVDLNYWDTAPPLLPALTARGVAFDDGWGMLVAQAVGAFTLFTGQRLSLEKAHALLGPR